MATAQTELTTAHTELTTEDTELIEKLTCLEYEASQLTRAYQLWRSCVEQGSSPDWMGPVVRITYDALIKFYLEISIIQADGANEFSARHVDQLEAADREIPGIWREESTTSESSPEVLPMAEAEQSELTELTTEQAELIEKLNCLEFAISQLNRAYQLWRSYVEQGTTPDWMAVAIRITYDALIKFYLEVSTIPADVPRASSNGTVAHLEAAFEIPGILEEETTTVETSPELLPITEPDWSGPELPAISPPSAAERFFDQPAVQQEEEEEGDVRHASSARHVAQSEAADCEIPDIFEEESTTAHSKLRNNGAARGPHAEPSPELLPMTEPDWSRPELRGATFLFSNGHPISEQAAIQQVQEKCKCRGCVSAREEEAGVEISGILEEESTITEPSPELLPMTGPDWSRPEMPAAISTDETFSEQPAMQQEEEADLPNTFSALNVAQLVAADCDGISEEEFTAAEPSLELLPEPEWCWPEAPAAISPLSSADTISDQPAIHQGRQEEETGAKPAVIHIPATLARWLQRSSTGMLFLAASVAILIIVGGAMGIYLASPHHAAPNTVSVENSGSQAEAGALAIPTSEKAEFKFDPDLVVARQGSSFVLNAVLSRGSDIASVAAQIDYDANLLQFMGASQGGFLVKDGQQVVLAQRNDPLTGVLRLSAEKPPGKPGISGDGPVFALSFQARKRGLATVSIVPGAHD